MIALLKDYSINLFLSHYHQSHPTAGDSQKNVIYRPYSRHL